MNPTIDDKFDALYKASLDPRLAALIGAPYSDAKRASTLALAHANLGLVVDNPIMVWNWSASWVMQERKIERMALAPDGLGRWIIKVSTDPADYPPFTPPPPPHPKPPTNLDPVGPQSGSLDPNMYNETVLGAMYPANFEVTNSRGSFTHMVIGGGSQGGFRHSWWEKHN